MYNNSIFDSNKKIKVAVLKDALPFSNCEKNVKPSGITIDIWEKTANRYNINYEYICVDKDYDNTVNQVGQGIYDVALAEFSVISRRYDIIEYSRPFFVSNMKIYRKKNDNLFKNFFTNRIVKLLITIAIIILFIYSIIRKYTLNIGYTDALYETYTIFFTNVKDFITTNKKSFPLKLKIINGFWIFIRYVFFTIVVAQAVNIIVKKTNHITDDEYDRIKKINVLKGTSYVDYVKNIGKQAELNVSNQEIIRKIKNSNYDEYWLDDFNVITNAIYKSKYNLQLDSTLTTVINDEFAIIVNKNNKGILDKINKTIVELQDTGDMLRLCKGFMKVEYEGCSM